MLKKYPAHHIWIGDRRCYQVGEQIFPGVTTILGATKLSRDKQVLAQWREKVGEVEADKITSDACDRGTIVHGLIEDYLQGKESPCPDGVKGFWDSIRPALINVSDVQLIEGAVWHPSGFAGSVDCVASWKGQPTIIDWKTSGKPKKSEWITDYKQQTAGYCAAVNRLYGLKFNHSVIVIALEDSPAQVFEVSPVELMEHWRNFQERVKQYHQKFPLPIAA